MIVHFMLTVLSGQFNQINSQYIVRGSTDIVRLCTLSIDIMLFKTTHHKEEPYNNLLVNLIKNYMLNRQNLLSLPTNCTNSINHPHYKHISITSASLDPISLISPTLCKHLLIKSNHSLRLP